MSICTGSHSSFLRLKSMEHFGVPGVAIAVINGGAVEWVRRVETCTNSWPLISYGPAGAFALDLVEAARGGVGDLHDRAVV